MRAAQMRNGTMFPYSTHRLCPEPSASVTFVVLIAVSLAAVHAQDARYRDPALPVDARGRPARAHDARGKGRALIGIWGQKVKIQDEAGRFVPAMAKALIGQGIGQISRPSEIAGPSAGRPVRQPREHAEFVNAVQKWVTENTRLGIPVMFHEEALHGLAAPRGTHFPVPIGLGSTWDPALVERLMSVAAKKRAPAAASMCSLRSSIWAAIRVGTD